jgi:DNA modification methylase
MNPYYQDDAVTIYHGDCREILPQLEPVDLVLTDPPYLNMLGGTIQISGGVAARINNSITVYFVRGRV